ncbi:hypothetical protein [Streptomyces sp. WAC06614]|uniref:hypothetical protein n=1 Tax=Streptomyces sp. WAC06614 TaxID=2487416 RepID=UPI000F7B26E2|nr:hypothetical protein [Streptomyces sp. WAC06614]RSS56159.1 hypothetical protein EF918_34410 [Streptomyces sp. WAC06614]
MDPEIAALATTAGSTLVGLMTTEAWQSARQGVVALWRRAVPERADGVDSSLEAAQEDLVAARGTGDEETVAELTADWQGRFRRLLVARPDLAAELRALLSLPEPGAAAPVTTTLTQTARARGNARVYQAGGNLTVREDGGRGPEQQ